MFRFVLFFCLLSLLVSSVGCRTCCTPHDYRLSTYIDRCDDYRGFDPQYRAGSILGWHSTSQMVMGDAVYVGQIGDYYNNAGNYGVTTPIALVRHTPDTVEQPTGQELLIGIPQDIPEERTIVPPSGYEINGNIPTIDQLRDRQRGLLPYPTPIMPPGIPRVPPPALDDDTIPFAPSDEQPLIPPSTIPSPMIDSDPPITLDELRRLDPSIQDLQIISIEDASVGAAVK